MSFFSSVGHALGSVGSSIGHAVSGAVNAVKNTVTGIAQGITSDPLGSIAMIGTAIVAPELLPLMAAGVTMAHGGSPLDALKSAGLAYAGAELGSEVASSVGEATGSQALGKAAGTLASNEAKAAATGQDLGQAALSSLSGSAMGQGMGALGDATGISNAFKTGVNAIGDTFKEALPSDLSDTFGGLKTDLAGLKSDIKSGISDYMPSGLSGVGSDIKSTISGGLQDVKDVASNTWGDLKNAFASSDNSSDGSMPDQQTQNVASSGAGSSSNDSVNLKYPGLASMASGAITKGLTSALGSSPSAAPSYGSSSYQSASSAPTSYSSAATNPWLDTSGQYLENRPVDMTTVNNQDYLSKMDPELARLFAQRGIIPGQSPVGMYASGGGIACLNSCSEYAPKFIKVQNPTLQTYVTQHKGFTLPALHQIMPTISQQGNMGGYKSGGLPQKYHDAAPEGHNPEFITGLTGFYANGGGTGQSDDIPAMLHDGDYVIDAESVSALGDGSSKAGKNVLDDFMGQIPHHQSHGSGQPIPAKIADGEYVLPESFVTSLGGGDNKRGASILDKMRHEIREQKRSAPIGKIPPKALTPLEYIRKAKV